MDDAYDANEGIRIRVRPDREVSSLTATVVYLSPKGRNRQRTAVLKPKGELMESKSFTLKPGAYRVTVAGRAAVDPVADVFVVQ